MLAQASVNFNFVSQPVILDSSVGCTLGEQVTGMVVDYPYNRWYGLLLASDTLVSLITIEDW